MKVSILIVTHGKDFPWLRHCVKSIQKFAQGFAEVCIAIPQDEPWDEVLSLLNEGDGPIPVRLYPFEDWPGKGFVRHAHLIMCSDLICPSADFVLHMDSDCVFREPVLPEDYFVSGKPVLIGAPYEWVVNQFSNPNHYKWRDAVVAAIGGKSEQEFMRRHPAVHYRHLYGKARHEILTHTRMDAAAYIRSTKNEFPQTFAEFPTLGEVAWRYFHPLYEWVRQDKDPWPHDKLIQLWSHGSPDKPNNVWLGGRLHAIVPNDLFNQLGI